VSSLAPGLGVAVLGALGSLTPHRPFSIVFELIALVWTYLCHYGWCVLRPWEEGFGAVLECLRPSSEKDAGLIIASVFVFAVIVAPPRSVFGLVHPKDPVDPAAGSGL
jgi:hypothetical protein